MSDTKWSGREWSYALTEKGRPKVVDQSGFTIATAGAQPYNHSDFHLLASSRLLYEALEHAKEMLEEYETEATGESFNSLMINAALAKARGES